MLKWYEQPEVDGGIIISSRVRLARNLAKYYFPSRMSLAAASTTLAEINGSIFSKDNVHKAEEDGFRFLNLEFLSNFDLNAMYERHVISSAMVDGPLPRGLISNEMENISILANEEDHVRIQSIIVGQDLNKAYEMANQLDDVMSATLDYAFSPDFGFLTSCPTNTGTGLRASYMLHIPMLDSTGFLKSQADFIAKTGFVLRGIHGEGSQSLGSIYQISNQVTLGRKEEDIILSLEKMVEQIAEKESQLRQHMLAEYMPEAQDVAWRSLGILMNCRKISLSEAMKCLSEIRLARMIGILPMETVEKATIYSLMINIHPFNLQKNLGPAMDERHLDILRADYLRGMFVG